MSNHDDFDENASSRTNQAPYTERHPIPTISRYQDRKQERQEDSEATVPQSNIEHEAPKKEEHYGLFDSTKRFLHLDGHINDETINEQYPYSSYNRNVDGNPPDSEGKNDHRDSLPSEGGDQDGSEKSSTLKDTSEATDSTLDPRQKRKNMKHMKRDHAPREVTDPVTHLKVMVHDTTNKELQTVPANEPPPGSSHRSATGASAGSKTKSELEQETQEQQAVHQRMEKLFPPPSFAATKTEISSVYSLAFTVGTSSLLLTALSLLVGSHFISGRTDMQRSWPHTLLLSSLLLVFGVVVGGGIIWGIRGWLIHRINDIWDEEVWDSARKQEQETISSPMPESTQWLNSLLSSVWPLINPELFTSLADTLEDVMQASLPKLVRMVSVEDLGQGNEAIRILGVRWLPTEAAAKTVSKDGKVKNDKDESDRKVPGQGGVDDETKPDDVGSSGKDEQSKGDEQKKEGDEENIAEGMEAEEGDFVNVEVGFSYRASSSGKGIKEKSKNAHLFLAFYLPGGIRFPVWVELRGIVGTMRLRLQLCPDPPFFALCTLTFLGQPKADLSCVPLTKRGLNLMDLPLISSFVQSSIDAALAEYVAPKSLTLDLKDMLVGDDFKKDTTARGVLMVKIKRGRNFKAGDPGLGILKKASSDAYVAVGWAKFGKPVWSTRVIVSDMEPVWDETAFILVGPEELNAEERIRVQLWDSDRTSADDDLGRIELDLKELMHSPQSKEKMWDRTDGFLALEGSKEMPGTLDWSVGYFSKTSIRDEQLKKQTIEEDVRSLQGLKDKVSNDAKSKLREATTHDESHELDQQKAQMLKSKEDAMIISTPPLEDYPTGILAIQIHQITGLEFERINKGQSKGDEGDDVEEDNDLPSSYSTVILNHQTVFKTRTKPKNPNPFFNAGTERFIRDWRTTEVIVSVRDSRIHENDPLLGIVALPLGKILRGRSQVMDNYPLVGGLGYGRVRISMVFRSIKLQAPKELLGWDSYGTLEVTGPITSKDISPDLRSLRMKIRTTINRGKMYSSETDTENGSQWTGKHERPVRVAVRKRYCSCVVIEFRKNNLGLDKTPAFAVLWLKDIPDEEDRTVTLPVWKSDSDTLKRAQSNCDDNLGERMGTIEVPIKFYRGLGAYHHKLTSKSPNLSNVFEVLSTADDNHEVDMAMSDEESAGSSDSSDPDEEGPHHAANGVIRKLKINSKSSTDGAEDDGHKGGGPIDQIKDYKVHSEQLHRRHRGLMQWKGARTANYLKTKVQHGKDHLTDHFKHHERDPGIETEV